MKKDLGYMHNLRMIFNTPLDKVNFLDPKGMLESLKETESRMTIHLYRPEPRRLKEKRLVDLADSTYNQMYITVADNVNCLITNGASSGRRENHNAMLESILKDKEFRKIPTMIMVMHRNDILSYYFHPGFAYVDHDIGSNWNKDIRKKIEKSKLPYSEYKSDRGLGFEVIFDNGRRLKVYTAKASDILGRKFNEKL